MRRIVSVVTALVMLLGLFVIDIPTSAEDAWASIYANYIGSSSFDTENTQNLLLADLNVDGTPELLRLREGGGMGETVMQPMTVSGSSIMTCSGSNAVYLGYLIQKMSINLYRKDNRFVWVIVVDCPTDSIGSDFIHKVFEISMNGKTVKAVGRFELRGTQSGGRIYYRDGKKVSKSTYISAYKSYFRKLKSMNMSAVEGNPNAWYENAAAVRISAFNAMVSQYRAEMQNAIPVTNVSLNKTKVSLALGKTYTLKASVSPSYALNKAITWRSDNTSVATVSGGTVKAVGYGTAKITATAPSGKYSVCSISVPRPSATKVTIINNSSEVTTGSTLQLAASVSPSAASQSVTWTSSNKSVATVDSKGLVKGHKLGTATITAKTSNGKKATKTIRVKPAVEVTGVNVVPATASVEAGKTKQLTATVQPTSATDKTLTWTSSDTSVATVSSAGLVSAKKVGSTTITAKANNSVSGACIVTVTAAVVPVTSVNVSPMNASVEVGKTKQLTATVQPSNATDKTLTWTSSDTSVATVSSAGLVTAKKVGTATITALAVSGTKATCVVTVINPPAEPVWSDWGTWQDNRESTSETKQEQTRIVYPYYYFQCERCGAHMHVYTSCYTWAGGCGYSSYIHIYDFVEIWDTTSYDAAGLKDWYGTGRYYAYLNGVLVFKRPEVSPKTQYRYRTLTTPVYTTGITLSPSSASVAVGETVTFTAILSPSNATNTNITWTSANSNIATVSGGVVTGRSAGTTTITASTSNGKSDTCQVTVTGAPSVQISITDATWPSGTLYYGVPFSIRGIITSNQPITNVTAGIYYTSGAGTSYVMSVYPNAMSYSLSGTINAAMRFSMLASGSYVYRVNATAGGETKELINSTFSIEAGSGPVITSLNDNNMFLKQQTSVTCTLCSATMMLRRKAFLKGADPRPITESAVRSVAWGSGGLAGTFTYNGMTVTMPDPQANSSWRLYGMTSAQKKTLMMNMLNAHPEGIVIYDEAKPHAVLLTDYQGSNDTFYAADPAGSSVGRVALTSTTMIGSTQMDKVAGIDAIWYIP